MVWLHCWLEDIEQIMESHTNSIKEKTGYLFKLETEILEYSYELRTRQVSWLLSPKIEITPPLNLTFYKDKSEMSSHELAKAKERLCELTEQLLVVKRELKELIHQTQAKVLIDSTPPRTPPRRRSIPYTPKEEKCLEELRKGMDKLEKLEKEATTSNEKEATISNEKEATISNEKEATISNENLAVLSRMSNEALNHVGLETDMTENSSISVVNFGERLMMKAGGISDGSVSEIEVKQMEEAHSIDDEISQLDRNLDSPPDEMDTETRFAMVKKREMLIHRSEELAMEREVEVTVASPPVPVPSAHGERPAS